MSKIHKIKCGNGNCYIVENGTSAILIDTGKKEYVNQELFSDTFLGKIVLSASLKEFSVRPMRTFKSDILLKDNDSLSDYGINANIVSLPGHTDGSMGIDVDNKYLVVGDALMNMFYPTVSMLFHNQIPRCKQRGI